MEDKDLGSFEWVKARAACSLAAIFEKLKMDLRSDVSERQALLPQACPYAFKLVVSSKIAAVLVEGPRINGSIEFRLAETTLENQWTGMRTMVF